MSRQAFAVFVQIWGTAKLNRCLRHLLAVQEPQSGHPHLPSPQHDHFHFSFLPNPFCSATFLRSEVKLAWFARPPSCYETLTKTSERLVATCCRTPSLTGRLCQPLSLAEVKSCNTCETTGKQERGVLNQGKNVSLPRTRTILEEVQNPNLRV